MNTFDTSIRIYDYIITTGSGRYKFHSKSNRYIMEVLYINGALNIKFHDKIYNEIMHAEDNCPDFVNDTAPIIKILGPFRLDDHND